MKKILYSAAFIVAFGRNVTAQTDSLVKRSGFPITMHTMNNNYIKGVLVSANDSMVNIFPGSVHQWKKGENFKTASFVYENIKSIKLKKRRSVMKGMLIGGAVGMLPAIASSLTGHTGTKGSYAVISVITVPVGMISGGVIGMSSGRKFKIEGEREKYQQFLSDIK